MIKPFKKTLSFKIEGFTKAVRESIIKAEHEQGYFYDALTCYDISGDVEMEIVEMEYQIAQNKKQQAE